MLNHLAGATIRAAKDGNVHCYDFKYVMLDATIQAVLTNCTIKLFNVKYFTYTYTIKISQA